MGDTLGWLLSILAPLVLGILLERFAGITDRLGKLLRKLWPFGKKAVVKPQEPRRAPTTPDAPPTQPKTPKGDPAPSGKVKRKAK